MRTVEFVSSVLPLVEDGSRTSCRLWSGSVGIYSVPKAGCSRARSDDFQQYLHILCHQRDNAVAATPYPISHFTEHFDGAYRCYRR